MTNDPSAAQRQIDEHIRRALLSQVMAQERDLRAVAATHGRSVIVHTDQAVDDLWLGDRTLIRSPNVPVGTAYEYDPAVLDLRAGLGQSSL